MAEPHDQRHPTYQCHPFLDFPEATAGGQELEERERIVYVTVCGADKVDPNVIYDDLYFEIRRIFDVLHEYSAHFNLCSLVIANLLQDGVDPCTVEDGLQKVGSTYSSNVGVDKAWVSRRDRSIV